jgi:hypothetical protein
MECVNRVRKTIKIMKKVDKGNLNYTPTYLTPSHDGCCNMRVLCVNKRRGGEREEENLILWLDLHLGQKEKLQKNFSHPCVVYFTFFFAIPPPMKLNLGLQIGGRILTENPTWTNHYDYQLETGNSSQIIFLLHSTTLWQVHSSFPVHMDQSL